MCQSLDLASPLVVALDYPLPCALQTLGSQRIHLTWGNPRRWSCHLHWIFPQNKKGHSLQECWHCQHQPWSTHCKPANNDSVPEQESNQMADDASRLHHLTDAQLPSYFEQNYLQDKPWRLLHPKSETLSWVISSLQCRSASSNELLHQRQYMSKRI